MPGLKLLRCWAIHPT